MAKNKELNDTKSIQQFQQTYDTINLERERLNKVECDKKLMFENHKRSIQSKYEDLLTKCDMQYLLGLKSKVQS